MALQVHCIVILMGGGTGSPPFISKPTTMNNFRGEFELELNGKKYEGKISQLPSYALQAGGHRPRWTL